MTLFVTKITVSGEGRISIAAIAQPIHDGQKNKKRFSSRDRVVRGEENDKARENWQILGKFSANFKDVLRLIRELLSV
jgi:hypothetical protein